MKSAHVMLSMNAMLEATRAAPQSFSSLVIVFVSASCARAGVWPRRTNTDARTRAAAVALIFIFNTGYCRGFDCRQAAWRQGSRLWGTAANDPKAPAGGATAMWEESS